MARPTRIGDALGELFLKRGYGRMLASAGLDEAWAQVVGEKIAAQTRVGKVRRGVLEVTVSSSVLVQEMTFAKAGWIGRLAQLAPDQAIRDLRFRVGPVGARSV